MISTTGLSIPGRGRRFLLHHCRLWPLLCFLLVTMDIDRGDFPCVKNSRILNLIFQAFLLLVDFSPADKGLNVERSFDKMCWFNDKATSWKFRGSIIGRDKKLFSFLKRVCCLPVFYSMGNRFFHLQKPSAA